MKTIYAFYTSIPNSDQNEEFTCSNWWKTSWENQGWTTAMLNRSHAQCSNLYNKLSSKLLNSSNKLDINRRHQLDLLMARFTRWCALHAAGGGWMSDYDVFNIGFTQDKADEIEKTGSLIVCGKPAYLFYATRDLCSAAIGKFISGEIFDGSEADLLNSKNQESLLNKSIKHCHSTKLKKRSQVMQGLA